MNKSFQHIEITPARTFFNGYDYFIFPLNEIFKIKNGAVGEFKLGARESRIPGLMRVIQIVCSAEIWDVGVKVIVKDGKTVAVAVVVDGEAGQERFDRSVIAGDQCVVMFLEQSAGQKDEQ